MYVQTSFKSLNGVFQKVYLEDMQKLVRTNRPHMVHRACVELMVYEETLV